MADIVTGQDVDIIAPISDRVASGTIAGVGQTVSVSTQGCGIVGLQVTGTYSGTITVQGTVDGSTWVNIIMSLLDGSGALVSTINANGLYQIRCAGLSQIRATSLFWTTGTANLTFNATNAQGMQIVNISHFGGALTSLGQKASASSIPVALPSDQTVTISETSNPTFYATFDRIVPAVNKYMATLFNTSSSRKVVIQRIWRYNWQTSAVTGVLLEQYLARITARTSGTSVTIRSEDTSDSLSSGITADHNSSAVTENHIIRRLHSTSEEVLLTANNMTTWLSVDEPSANVWDKKDGTRGIVLRQNEGVTIRNVTSSSVGSVSYVFEFTDEAV